MATESDPIVNSWYQHLDKGQKFQVVAVDESDLVIEIQYFDGDIEEIDIDDWYQMDLEQIASPEDISGALDVSELDDLGSSITDTDPTDWDSTAYGLEEVEENSFSDYAVGSESSEEVPSYEEPWDHL